MTLPILPDTFKWTFESWGPALRCRPLEKLAPHLFTTRQLQLSSADHVGAMAAAVGAAAVFQLTQVHGRAVVTLRRGTAVPESRPEADAILSNAVEVAVAVRAADCVPMLLADRRTGVVGAVHAGWRGTAARVAAAAIHALEGEFGARPADLVVAIGPSIGPCCYEVGPELVDAFAAAGHERRLIDRWFLAPPAPPGARARAALRLDLPGANRDQLILTGVPEEQIHIAGLCTATNLDILTSYRAEKHTAGRIAAAIRAAARGGDSPRRI